MATVCAISLFWSGFRFFYWYPFCDKHHLHLVTHVYQCKCVVGLEGVSGLGLPWETQREHLSPKSAFCHWNSLTKWENTNFAGLSVKKSEDLGKIFDDVKDLFPEEKTRPMLAPHILPAKLFAINISLQVFSSFDH